MSSKASKTAQLTSVERDALRYRVLRRRIAEGAHLTLMYGSHCDFSTMTPSNLDDSCDRRIGLEDVAEVLIDSTQPTLAHQPTSAAIDENCVEHVRGIAASIERGIYQPLMPQDVISLYACARKAEKLTASLLSPQIRAEIESERRSAVRAVLLLIAASGGSIKVPIALVRDLPENLVLASETDHEQQCIIYSIASR